MKPFRTKSKNADIANLYFPMVFINILKYCVLAVIVSLLLSIAASHAAQFKVTRVSDGDTLKAENRGFKITVRLFGIDTPETSKKKSQPGQPYSKRAKLHLSKMVLDKTIDIEGYGLDRYSRMLGVVYVDGINVNIEMVKGGLAEVYRGRPPKGFNNEPYLRPKQKQEMQRLICGLWAINILALKNGGG